MLGKNLTFIIIIHLTILRVVFFCRSTILFNSASYFVFCITLKLHEFYCRLIYQCYITLHVDGQGTSWSDCADVQTDQERQICLLFNIVFPPRVHLFAIVSSKKDTMFFLWKKWVVCIQEDMSKILLNQIDRGIVVDM